MTKPKYYIVTVKCENCGRRATIKIPKGETVEESPCPYCETLRLVRIMKCQ